MEKLESNGFSIASMVCGITAIAFQGIVGIEFAIVALVMRSIYRKRTGGLDNDDTRVGYVTGLIALIVYGIQLVITIVAIILFICLTTGAISWAVLSEFAC